MRPQFDTIPRAEPAQQYFDKAMLRGREAAARVKGIADKLMLRKAKEKDRVRAIANNLGKQLMDLHDAYPSFDRVSDFLIQLFSLDMDVVRVRKALSSIHRTTDIIKVISKEYLERITRSRTEEGVDRESKAFFGRVASLMRQLDKHITVLNEARAVMRNLPSLDDELFTVAIAGFPNVGKSTLLSRLTTARPEIKPYAFTTKGLNVGYFEHRFNQIQCIDTPGTLHRAKMNAIERKADITLRYLAHCIISVIDPTEQSFTLAQQRTLHAHLEELDKPLFIYVSKTDIASQEQAARVQEMFPDATNDVAALKKAIAQAFKAWI